MSLEVPNIIDSKLLEANKDILEKEKSLSNFCEKNNNRIKFLKHTSEKKDELTIGELGNFLDEEEREVAMMILAQAENFLHSPAFTDSFHENHSARREWERKNIVSSSDKDLLSLYNSNRFNLNLLGLPLLFVAWAESLEEDYPLTASQRNAINRIRKNIDTVIPKKLSDYGDMNDEDKFKIITGLEVVFQEIVDLLAKK